ncbi:MAG: uroporphyrinogen decarboxylase family protein [Eubacteriales bacterium]
MNSTERVTNTILGKTVDRTPIYGWVSANLSNEISAAYGSVAAFEDRYEYDMAHLFAGPGAFRKDLVEQIRRENGELTPDLLVDEEIFRSPDNLDEYRNVSDALAFHKKRERFCYIQTPGFFEQFNDLFGIENQLLYLAMYPDELAELYRRQADWTIRFAGHCIDLGVDMIHISDDWGAQKDLLFSPKTWYELIYPQMKRVVDYVHSRGCFCSLHSDGCVKKVADGIAELGLDVVHPWQESAGMSYDLYLDRYADQFAILGGICVQSAIGLLPRDELEAEIRRVFHRLKGKRWICCTTHYVQSHCSIADLTFAYDLIYRLAREE